MFANLLNAAKRDRSSPWRSFGGSMTSASTTTANRDALVETFVEIAELDDLGGPERALVFRRLC